MDAMQKLFDWAEDHHYLTSTHQIINEASKQFGELEAQLTAQATLLKECWLIVKEISDGTCSDCELGLGVCIHQRATALRRKLEAAKEGKI